MNKEGKTCYKPVVPGRGGAAYTSWNTVNAMRVSCGVYTDSVITVTTVYSKKAKYHTFFTDVVSRDPVMHNFLIVRQYL